MAETKTAWSNHALELGEGERTVVASRGEAEAVLDQHVLARAVAAVHAAHLRQRDVRLVDEEQEVVREVVEQRRRLLARLAPGQVHRVVLDAGAVAGLLQHLEVVHRALPKARRFEQLALGLELLQPLFQLLLDVADRRAQLVLGGDEVLGRVDVDFEPLDEELAGQGIDLDDALDLVAEELDAQGDLLVGGEDLERVAAHAERAAHEGHVVAVVLDVDQMAHDLVAPRLTAAAERDDRLRVLLRRARDRRCTRPRRR